MSQNQKYKQKNRSRGKKVEHQKNKIKFPVFLKSIFQGILIISFFYFITEHNRGYHWTLHTLILENLEKMREYKHLTPGQRLNAKLGFTGSYFEYINTHTPENAIIIMPPDSVYENGKGKQKLDRYIKTSGWANYYVYPRKLVYERDKEIYPSVYDSAQYVAIIDYWGYNKLDYKLRDKVQYTVLPLKYELFQKTQQNQEK